MVEDVEEFSPKLKSHVFSNTRVLGNREIQIEEPWSVNRIPLHRPEGSIRRLNESSWVQIADRIRARSPIRHNRVHTRNHIGSLVEVRDRDAIESTGIVSADNRHRTPALRSHNRVQSPAAPQPPAAGDVGQSIGKRSRETLPGIEVRRT